MASLETAQKCSDPSCEKTSSSTSLQQYTRCKKAAYCSKACQAASWPTHKKRRFHQNYIVKFQLAPADITDPPVFRTISCPAETVFYHLHIALQRAFGWAATHSFDFAVPNPNYTYDFGDNWEHEMTLLGRAEPSDFVCIGGSGHPVAEDVGGTRGWRDLKEAYRTAQPDEEQRSKMK
ncbi:MM3350-like domain-containing protein [Daldinia sp. FL1419]|nr:MM3350-like domain-containing protein [Daldinia sp. FL1419]